MNKESVINLLQSDYVNEKIYESVVCIYDNHEGLLCTTLEKVIFYYEDTNENSFFYTILIKELYALEIRKDTNFTYLDLNFYQDKKMSFKIEKNNYSNYKLVNEKENHEGKDNVRKDFVKSLITYLLRHMKKTIKIDNDYIWNYNNKLN